MAARLTWICSLVLLLLAIGCEPADPPTHETITLGGEAWEMELAISEQQIEKGLMQRETIPPGTGMLFLFDENRVHSFWMGYCLSDIDLVFVDGMGRITAVHEMTTELPRQPGESEQAYRFRMPSYSSVFPARIAIELPPGTLKRLQLEGQQPTSLDTVHLEELRARSVATTR